MEKTKPYGTVLLRAAKIMDYLSDNPNQALQKIAQNTEMTTSTTLKILDTLLLIGFVSRDKNKNYRLGSKLIRYANQGVDQLDLVELTLPYLEKLQKLIDETIHLGVLADNEILYVNKLEAKHQTIRMSSRIGITRPLYSSAMGKAVLAELEEEEYLNYLKTTPLVPYTEHTITNSLKLAAELQKVRETGIAFDDEEMEKDIFCIGASLKKDGKIIGAFSVSMPKYRLTEEFKKQIIKAVVETKNEIMQVVAR
ncbi:IclR family transcriptional regulator [Niallia sp. FSL R7-0648]|uniref:IclR family transcriptional regulator n=1 Tax=Niallia sp. FSL R7-0648 TaxID=2954521 RepID=UPI0030F5656B